MTLFFAALHTVILYFLARYIIGRNADPQLRVHGWVSVILKIIAGWMLGLLYLEFYQGGDTFRFHALGSEIADIGRMDLDLYGEILLGKAVPPHADELLRAPRLFFMVKITSLLHLVTGNNYWITAAYLSFFCWAGLFSAVSRLISNYPTRRWLFLLAGLYLPSIVLWASGLTKESIAVGSFAFIIMAALPFGKFTIPRVLLILIMTLILWKIKYYYLVP
ncbi:MAG: hypothetical protein P8X57_10535, partial [Cyclobacteriaceae bacterium]